MDGGGGSKRVPPTHVHMYTRMHMHVHMTSYGIPRDSPNDTYVLDPKSTCFSLL